MAPDGFASPSIAAAAIERQLYWNRFVKSHKCMERRFPSLVASLLLLAGFAAAQSMGIKSACSEPNPEQLCNAENLCGSTSSPCSVNVKRTSDGASITPSIPNAKSNATFCVKVGTTVTWKTTSKDIGFLIDIGPASPFEPTGVITGGSDRSVSVVARKPGCYKYSAGACMSGAIYGMCGSGTGEVIIRGTN
jgi:plastocyanin